MIRNATQRNATQRNATANFTLINTDMGVVL